MITKLIYKLRKKKSIKHAFATINANQRGTENFVVLFIYSFTFFSIFFVIFHDIFQILRLYKKLEF